jgi:alpha-L-fucosidase
MKRAIRLVLTLLAATMLVPVTASARTREIKPPPVLPPSPAREARMAWWRQARFGMFIHWGLYSALGGEWQGKTVPHGGEWIMHNARIPVKDYEKVAATFNR